MLTFSIQWPKIRSCVVYSTFAWDSFLGHIDFLLLWQQNQPRQDLVVTHSPHYGFSLGQRPGQQCWFLVTDDTHVSSFFFLMPQANLGSLHRPSPKGAWLLRLPTIKSGSLKTCMPYFHWIFDKKASLSQGRKLTS